MCERCLWAGKKHKSYLFRLILPFSFKNNREVFYVGSIDEARVFFVFFDLG
jgi:hypothetical protein